MSDQADPQNSEATETGTVTVEGENLDPFGHDRLVPRVHRRHHAGTSYVGYVVLYMLMTAALLSFLPYFFRFIDIEFVILSSIIYSVGTVAVLFFLDSWWSQATIVRDMEQESIRFRSSIPKLFLILFVLPFLALCMFILVVEPRQFLNTEIYFIILAICTILSLVAVFIIFGMPAALAYLMRSGYVSTVSKIKDFFFFDISDTPEFERKISEHWFPTTLLDRLLSEIPTARSVVIQDLRKRAKKLALLNTLILLFVVVVLIVAALFIVFAGELASKDTKSLSTIQNLRESKQTLERSLVKLEDELVKLNGQIYEIKTTLKGDFEANNKDIAKSRKKLDSLMASLTAKVPIITSRIKRQTKNIEKLNETLAKFEDPVYLQPSKGGDAVSAASLLIAAGITRFGVLAIAIYLVQILINLYRYNVRVAGFYLSQADALLLLDHSPKKIGELTEKMRPDFEFGKTPASFPEKVFERFDKLYDETVARARKKVKKGAQDRGDSDSE